MSWNHDLNVFSCINTRRQNVSIPLVQTGRTASTRNRSKMFLFLLSLTAILVSQGQGSPVGFSKTKDLFESLFIKESKYTYFFEPCSGFEWNSLYSTDTSCKYPYEVLTFDKGLISTKAIDTCGVQHDFKQKLTYESYNCGYYYKTNYKIYYSIYFLTDFVAVLYKYDKKGNVNEIRVIARADKYGYSCTTEIVSALVDILEHLDYKLPYVYSDYPSAVDTVTLTADTNFASTIYVKTCDGAVVGAEE